MDSIFECIWDNDKRSDSPISLLKCIIRYAIIDKTGL